jgi:antitoxin MazE
MARPVRRIDLKLVRIGNSRGLRLPRALLAKYRLADVVVLEEREGGLVLRGKGDTRLSWDETYRDMAREREDWSDLDAAIADGLEADPW